MAGLGIGAGPPVMNVYHEKSRILPDVSTVFACLYEKHVKFEPIRASYKDLFSLQASRSVPVPFYDGPVFLQDSRAICRYIAETYDHQGYPFLLGKDVLERASIEQWLRHQEHAFDPPSRALFCHIAFPPEYEDDNDHEAISQETRKLDEVLEVYEQRLGETEFLAGNKFTLADLVHLPGTHHVITSDRFAYLYDSRKNVQRWWNEISSRDSWQKVLRDMKTVEEQHELEKQQELEEKQKQQWLTTPSQTLGYRDIRIDPRKQEGTMPQTVLVTPPSIGVVSTSIPPASQDHGTTSDQKPSSPNQTKQGGFFTNTENPPPHSRQTESTTKKSPGSSNSTKSTFFTPASTHTTSKAHQRTDAAKFSNKDVPSPTEKPPTSSAPSSRTDLSPRNTSQRSPREAPNKYNLSDSFKGSNPKDATGTLAMPSSQFSSKILRGGQPSDVVFTNKIDESDSRETESKPTGVSRQVDKPLPSTYTTPDTQTPQAPHVKPPAQRGINTFVGPEPDQKLTSDLHTAHTPSEGDTLDVTNVRNRFSTKRLRAVFNPDIEDSQYPSKQEEAPANPKKHSNLPDREKQITMTDSGKSGVSPSSNMQAPYAPVTDEERSGILPPKVGTATTGAEKSPHNQQVPHAAPDTDKLAQKAAMNIVAPQGAPLKNPSGGRNGLAPVHAADPSAILTGDEQLEKSSTMVERALEATPLKTSHAEHRGISTPAKEVTIDARVKQGQACQEIPEVQATEDDDTTKKTLVDKKAEEPSSQETTEPIRGISHILQGITEDASTKATPPAPVQALASGGQNRPMTPHVGTLHANRKEAVTPSPDDPRGTLPTTPRRVAPIPATERLTSSGEMSAQSLEAPLYDTRNEKTDIAETSQTSIAAGPNEKPGKQVPRNAGESSSGPSLMKAQEYVEAYKEHDDQSGAKLVGNRMGQGDDVASNAKTNKSKEEDYIANANNNNNRKAQATTDDAPYKLQIQSGKNKPETSKDADMGINKTANSRSLETFREVQPSSPENSMGQQQLQENRTATTLQDNMKKSTAGPLLRSGKEQQKKDDLPTEDKNNGKSAGGVKYEEKSSSDTQQDR